MQVMGNSKGRAVYECNLPENYRRSQTDSAMEQFIRGKYEARKWMSRDWVPPSISTADLILDDDKSKTSSGASANKIKLKTNSNIFNINQSPTSISSKPSKQEEKSPASTTAVNKDPVLLDFEFHSSNNSNVPITATSNKPVKNEEIDFFKTTTDSSNTPNLFENFDGLTFDHQSTHVKSQDLISPTPNTTQLASNPTNELEQINFNVNLDNTNLNKSKIDKQSILALYNNGVPRASSMQSFSNPNVQQQQQQQQQNQHQLFNQQNKMPFNNQPSAAGVGNGGLINLDQTFLKPQHSQQFQNSFQVNNVSLI
jgi:stromal membrane-associated protein